VERAIVWLRRDLRLADNAALHAACTAAYEVVPLFVLDPALIRAAGAPRRWFLRGALAALDAALRDRGSRLTVRGGRPETVIPALARECGAAAVFWNRDATPYARRRDAAVEAALQRDRVRVETRSDRVLHESHEVLTRAGRLPRVFSMYQAVWERLPTPGPLPAAPLRPMRATLPTEGLESLSVTDEVAQRLARWWTPSEQGALQALGDFLTARFESYARERDDLGSDATSRLSPHLHFGTLSARVLLASAAATASSPEGDSSLRLLRRELCFRDFYAAQLAARPGLRREPYVTSFAHVGRDDPEALAAWQDGSTGYPIIDAAMRQLRDEGWMPNRARMIVASFLTKHLLVDYRHGEHHFMQQLVDGDVANNNAGWQWAAGTGVDAPPYFRIFNPVAQGERHDPHGVYVRRHLAALAQVPDEYVHRPWTMTAAEQRAAHCVVDRDYPAPIVDHASARRRALATYRAAHGR
jgi:deoxyribodipyrimidine photo-lyase